MERRIGSHLEHVHPGKARRELSVILRAIEEIERNEGFDSWEALVDEVAPLFARAAEFLPIEGVTCGGGGQDSLLFPTPGQLVERRDSPPPGRGPWRVQFMLRSIPKHAPPAPTEAYIVQRQRVEREQRVERFLRPLFEGEDE